MFQRITGPSYSGQADQEEWHWRWRHYNPSEHCEQLTQWHSLTAYNNSPNDTVLQHTTTHPMTQSYNIQLTQWHSLTAYNNSPNDTVLQHTTPQPKTQTNSKQQHTQPHTLTAYNNTTLDTVLHHTTHPMTQSYSIQHLNLHQYCCKNLITCSEQNCTVQVCRPEYINPDSGNTEPNNWSFWCKNKHRFIPQLYPLNAMVRNIPMTFKSVCAVCHLSATVKLLLQKERERERGGGGGEIQENFTK
jgi:hypothetical protein